MPRDRAKGPADVPVAAEPMPPTPGAGKPPRSGNGTDVNTLTQREEKRESASSLSRLSITSRTVRDHYLPTERSGGRIRSRLLLRSLGLIDVVRHSVNSSARAR